MPCVSISDALAEMVAGGHRGSRRLLPWKELAPIAGIPSRTSLECLSDQPGEGAKSRSSDGKRGTMNRLLEMISGNSRQGACFRPGC